MAMMILRADSQVYGLELEVEFAQELLNVITAYEQLPKTNQEKAAIMAMFADCISVCQAAFGGETSGDLYVNGMVRRLEQEPFDCVIEALKSWPDVNSKRPMWAELKAFISEKNKSRNRFRHGIYKSAGGYKSGLRPYGDL